MVLYSVHFFCNECSDLHQRKGISLPLDDGPSIRASIGATYAGKGLPALLANLGANVLTCPNTGKLTSQKDNYKVFLVSEIAIRGFRLVSYQSLGAGWIPAAEIRESTEGIETITPIYDATRRFATVEEANNAALAMAITWMNSKLLLKAEDQSRQVNADDPTQTPRLIESDAP